MGVRQYYPARVGRVGDTPAALACFSPGSFQRFFVRLPTAAFSRHDPTVLRRVRSSNSLFLYPRLLLVGMTLLLFFYWVHPGAFRTVDPTAFGRDSPTAFTEST